MKKILLILIVLTLTQGLVAKKKRFEISFNLNIMSSETRSEIYKITKDSADEPISHRMNVTGDWYPEVKLRFNLFGGLYTWGSFGFSYTKIQFSDSQTSPDQTVFKTGLAGGLGLTFFGYKDVDNLSLSIEAGYAYYNLSAKDDANDISLSKGALVTQLVFMYVLNEKMFLEANVGFSSAYDKYALADIKLGGFKIGLGGGLRF